jgi:hypothetical protein
MNTTKNTTAFKDKSARRLFQRLPRKSKFLAARACLAIGVVTGALATSAEAAVVQIDVSSFSGVNGGVAAGGLQNLNPFPTTGGANLILANAFSGMLTGLTYQNGGFIAAGASPATPVEFAAGALIDETAGGGGFTDNGSGNSLFMFLLVESPDFGPNSFLGFKDALGRYGYIETTWNSTTNQFQIFSAAYESEVGVGIRTPGAVPEPSTMALAGLAFGYSLLRRRKQA